MSDLRRRSNKIEEKTNSKTCPKGVEGDERNILVLLFLYILQGIPLGLAAAIPLILTNRHVRWVLIFLIIALISFALGIDKIFFIRLK